MLGVRRLTIRAKRERTPDAPVFDVRDSAAKAGVFHDQKALSRPAP